MAGRDPLIQRAGIQVFRPGISEPDFYSPGTHAFWDLTTGKQWQAHVNLYGPNFGAAYQLTYR